MDFEGLTGRVAFDMYGLRRDYMLKIYEVGLDYGPEIVGNSYQLCLCLYFARNLLLRYIFFQIYPLTIQIPSKVT